MYLFSLCHAYCWSSLHRSNISLSLAILFFPSTFMGKVVFGRRSVLEYFFEGSFFFSNFMCEQCNVLIVCLCSCVTRAPELDNLRDRLVDCNMVILLISFFLDERHSEIALLNRLSALQCTAGRLIHFQRPHSTIPLFAGRPTERICWICESNFKCSGGPPQEGLFMKETSYKFSTNPIQ